MELFGAVLSAAMEIMKTPFTIFEFTFSWWDVLIWGALATVGGTLIVRFLCK